jgi:cytochrome c oxidase subunit 3
MTIDAVGALREPWPDLDRQRQGVELGMWIFLASEVLFFGALFVSYAIYRVLYPEVFRQAAAQTEVLYGTLNTVLLLTSSMTMTIALRAAGAGLRRATLSFLVVTAALGAGFLLVKGMEYHDDIARSLVPGVNFPLSSPSAQLFWTLYWIMTGVHAIHLSVGIVVVAAVTILFWRRVVPVQDSTLGGVALYWHFVDCVWIVLYPLIYLGGRS